MLLFSRCIELFVVVVEEDVDPVNVETGEVLPGDCGGRENMSSWELSPRVKSGEAGLNPMMDLDTWVISIGVG